MHCTPFPHNSQHHLCYSDLIIAAVSEFIPSTPWCTHTRPRQQFELVVLCLAPLWELTLTPTCCHSHTLYSPSAWLPFLSVSPSLLTSEHSLLLLLICPLPHKCRIMQLPDFFTLATTTPHPLLLKPHSAASHLPTVCSSNKPWGQGGGGRGGRLW